MLWCIGSHLRSVSSARSCLYTLSTICRVTERLIDHRPQKERMKPILSLATRHRRRAPNFSTDEQLQTACKSKDAEIAGMKKEAAANARYQASLEDDNAIKNAWLARCQENGAEKDEEIAEQEKEIAEKDEEIAGLKKEIARVKKTNSALNAKILNIKIKREETGEDEAGTEEAGEKPEGEPETETKSGNKSGRRKRSDSGRFGAGPKVKS